MQDCEKQWGWSINMSFNQLQKAKSPMNKIINLAQQAFKQKLHH